MSKYIGSPTGSGNPPGKHSDSYLNNPGKGGGNFNTKKSYRGNMHVKINKTATLAGNQPKSKKTSSVGQHTKAL